MASKRYSRVVAYAAGWSTTAAYILSAASVNAAMASQTMGYAVINNPDFVIKRWMLFVVYIFYTIASVFAATFAYKTMVKSNFVILVYTVVTCLVSVIVLLACSRGQYMNSEFVWARFYNSTGWTSNVACFLTGLINSAFGYGVIDVTARYSEEVHEPQRNVPFAIGSQIVIGLPTGFIYTLVLFYCIRDLDAFLDSSVPNATVYAQAAGKAGGYVLLTFIYLQLIVCCLETPVCAARMLWSFSRDKPIFASDWLRKVHPRYNVPLNAQLVVMALMLLLGLIYLFAETAFNALTGSALLLINVSYLLTIGTNMLRKRRGITIPGPFSLGRWGFAINMVAIVWLMFTIVIWCLPYYMPVIGHLENMNWTVVIIGGVQVVAWAWWFIRGRSEFVLPQAAGLPQMYEGDLRVYEGEAVVSVDREVVKTKY